MHNLRMEIRPPTVRAWPLLWIHWEKLEVIKLKILAYFFERVVLSLSLHTLIQLFSSIWMNIGFWNIHRHASHVGEYSATILLNFRK